MSPAIPDLWPPEVFATSSPTSPATPLTILRRQGEALGAHTQNFVLGEVETSAGGDGRQFAHFFWLIAPLLQYRKALLKVTHGLQPYPATVVETELTKQADQSYWSREAKDEQELQDRLREFFNEPRVKEVLRSVITLSNDVAPADVIA
jgi:hypothetical protein